MEFICLADQQPNIILITLVTLGRTLSFCANLIGVTVPTLLNFIGQKPGFSSLSFRELLGTLISERSYLINVKRLNRKYKLLGCMYD